MNKQMSYLGVLFMAISVLSGCVTVKKNAIFSASGDVLDSYGNRVVINSSQNIQLCVKADYVTDQGVADSSKECSDIVTDQNGHYTTTVMLKIANSNADKTIEIKNAKVYGQKYETSESRYYYFPVSVTQSEINVNGGSFIANMSIFTLD